MRYALFGGTFNPIHVGHIISALEIKDMFLIDKVIFIPNGVPPHKRGVTVSAENRYKMVVRSVSDFEGFEVSDIETRSNEENYTYNTIKYFKELYKNDELFFCIGTDAFLHIDTWQEWDKLLKTINFIIITRPGYNMKKIEEKYSALKYVYVKREGRYPSKDLFTYVYYKKIDISSTEIRERVKEGKSIKYYVPPQVEEIIHTKGFYQSSTLKEEENKKMFKEVTCPKCGHPVYVYRNPLLTVDCIIEKDDKVLLINRENHPLGYALPGGYVDYGERVEQAVIREIKEETNLDIVTPKLFGVYSDPERDPRGHTVTIVFHVKTTETPIAGDDAKDLGFFDLDNLPESIAFDHAKILEDYIEFRESQNLEEDEEEEEINEDEEEDIDTLREAIYEKNG